MPVIPKALPLKVMALELSRAWKITIPAYVPVVVGVSLIRAIAAQGDAAVSAAAMGYVLPALRSSPPCR